MDPHACGTRCGRVRAPALALPRAAPAQESARGPTAIHPPNETADLAALGEHPVAVEVRPPAALYPLLDEAPGELFV